MENIIINLSKYILVFLMLLYTYLCFRINTISTYKKNKGHVIAQKVFIMLIFAVCYALILYHNFSLVTFLCLALELIYLIFFPILFKVIYPESSDVITNNMTFMLALGFVMIERLAPYNAIKQFGIVMAGSVLFFFIPVFFRKKEAVIKAKYVYAIVGIILLAITLVLGRTSFGANLSFTIAGLTFQPSEFVKILFVLFVASMLSKSSGFKEILISAIFAFAHVIILVLSTDLGAALIFFIVYLIMIYIASGKVVYLLTGFAAGAGASVVAYHLFAHIRVRVSVWLNPWADIDGKGYQITQSLFAIGTGGWFGMGLYGGLPTSIPVVSKDFVFSAIAEDFGLIFAICVALVCVSIFLEIMKNATLCKDMFNKLLAAGIGVLYIFQCFLTIGGVTKFIPSTGVTLPFVSYGGSSILSSLIMFAIVQTVCMKVREDINEKEIRKSKE